MFMYINSVKKIAAYIISAIISIVSCVSYYDCVAAADYNLVLSLESDYNKKSSELEVKVVIRDNPGIAALVFQLYYDDSRVELISVDTGDIMKITYINHSGFLIETKDCYYIFDYFKGELPYLDKKKEVIIFCSHFHEDHFNPQIFGILDDMGMTYQAVLANDIRKRNHLSDLKITYVYHNQTYNLDNGTQVDTLLSNDSGVAFIVKTKEGTIYHAGDLNDWYWDGELKADNQRLTSAYRAEIRKIKGMHFDAAFVPLDPRQGDHYADGILYFLKNVDCNVIFPMHYWNDANVIKRFITEYPQYKSRIKNTECTKGEEL